MRQLYVYITRQAIAVEHGFVSTPNRMRNARVCQVECDPKSARCDETLELQGKVCDILQMFESKCLFDGLPAETVS